MSYPTPARVVLTVADIRSMTVLERARACATVGVRETEIAPLLRAVSSHRGSPEELERAVELLYAMAYQLGRRIEPALTWADAQTWELALDLDGPMDPLAEAEARAGVEASLATGLPPAEAGELTLAQLEAYGDVRAEAAGKPRRRDTRLERVPENQLPGSVERETYGVLPSLETAHAVHGEAPGEMLERAAAAYERPHSRYRRHARVSR